MAEKTDINELLGLYDDDEDDFRNEIATVDKQGKRIWIFAKKPSGKYYNKRKIVSYILLIILFGLPWLKVGGKPLFLFNIPESQFILFGYYFPPQDFYLLVIAMLIGIIFIALFTVIFGRVFCGWVCPQTIFMEMVYRRIEYAIEGDANAQKKLKKAPWNFDKIGRKTVKQALFFLIAVLIANTFLAYIIGIDSVLSIVTEPISQHLQGFIIMIIFSFVFYFVFAIMREQVCTTICPYGRLQSVLVDEKSLAVSYDFVRGEPRGKLKKNAVDDAHGDCIDCKLCIKVCPTGIDIRHGIQLECVNCTACMDACDEVMTKIDRPTGLIRVDSLEGIKSGKRSLVNKRSVTYSAILMVLVLLEGFLFLGRTEVDALLLRTPGTMYLEKIPGEISNLYNYQLNNKGERELNIRFEVSNIDAEIELIGDPPKTTAFAVSEGALYVIIKSNDLKSRKTKLIFDVYADGVLVDQVKTNFMGPIK